ncbi:hypothetical protein AAHE18_05G143200 [Arachis hypogaea]
MFRKTGFGRAPSVLVLLPNRELASQVYADFEVYGGAMRLSSCCLYMVGLHTKLKRISLGEVLILLLALQVM